MAPLLHRATIKEEGKKLQDENIYGLPTTRATITMWANAQRDSRPAGTQVASSVQRRKVWLTSTTRCRAVMLPRRETS